MIPDYNTACYGRPGANTNRGAGQDRFLPISDILKKDTRQFSQDTVNINKKS